jgi:mRNA deadenylase 3'-5' endonuclease subunit Ccr4
MGLDLIENAGATVASPPIRIISWNVLADAYIKDEHYPHSPAELLERGARRTVVGDRLLALADKADILCLQEVDTAQFALAEEKLITTEAGSGSGTHFGRHFKKRGKGEGCAIFIRKTITNHNEPEWKELVFTDHSSHIALGATLNFIDVTIVCTHLKWEPDGTPKEEHRGRVQLAEVLDAWPSGARIICGDFNAEPTSDVVGLAIERGFKDAYVDLPDAFTCNTSAKKRRIDFILHTSEFKATPTPLSPITDETALPSDKEPSDHLAIEAQFERV